VAKLTDTDALVAARCAAPGWIRWAQSTRDGMAHAFPIPDSQCDRWLRAVCSHTLPLTALGPATVVGVRCSRCALAATAARTARHRATRPGKCARLRAWLLGWFRDHRHDPQPPPLAQVPGIRLPFSTVHPAPCDGRTAAITEPGPAAWGGLVVPRPMHHHPGVVR
jgi:hypothetical protein